MYSADAIDSQFRISSLSACFAVITKHEIFVASADFRSFWFATTTKYGHDSSVVCIALQDNLLGFTMHFTTVYVDSRTVSVDNRQSGEVPRRGRGSRSSRMRSTGTSPMITDTWLRSLTSTETLRCKSTDTRPNQPNIPVTAAAAARSPASRSHIPKHGRAYNETMNRKHCHRMRRRKTANKRPTGVEFTNEAINNRCSKPLLHGTRDHPQSQRIA
jgi:hypothetical protein